MLIGVHHCILGNLASKGIMLCLDLIHMSLEESHFSFQSLCTKVSLSYLTLSVIHSGVELSMNILQFLIQPLGFFSDELLELVKGHFSVFLSLVHIEEDRGSLVVPGWSRSFGFVSSLRGNSIIHSSHHG